MAKRVRGKRSSAYRPGGQGRSRAKDPVSSSVPASGVAPDIDAAIAVSSEETVMETTELAIAEPEPASVTRKRKPSRRGVRAKNDSLEVRAAAEESWVREDLRNIALITGLLLVAIAIAWVVFVPLNLASLY